ncbi:3-keto-disaccharide hydrolase [Niabella drilacis]|uniref:3-keto-alpha-glucoside-1,2-lyase/3-keto-2-hydroxy-glucal hydratase domain-containing protein n=1 Tax=Niabella drilacis (strain DSM 25811 / CCM 8410 / CCUG 62505 / LMG 26954 / E90) TaxID=1285928 RepID=A0A1G7BV75_NIADE|nr:DUF1080 domain-containing protein [Niabella drilacis]SDE30913.1 protein of unknown function [Niabella drilacis]
MKTSYTLLFLLFVHTAFCQKADNTLSKAEKKQGWILLFDGQTTSGWTTTQGNPVAKGWQVAGGLLSTKSGGGGGDIVTENEYSAFILTLDFNIEKTCNSGIKYFYTKYATGGQLGLEFQVLDDADAEDNKKENHLCGSLYDVLAPHKGTKRINPPGRWNTIKIISRGKDVEHWLNGKRVLKFTRGDQAFLAAVEKSKFSKTVPVFGTVEKGKILLQEHGGTASFKNIKLLILK